MIFKLSLVTRKYNKKQKFMMELKMRNISIRIQEK